MENELKAVDGETLWDMEFGAQLFCIKGLLPQGVCILGGASKIGKSWMVLDWVDKVAKGEPVWGMETTQGTTLYLCLEDNLQRVQHRLYCISEEATPNAFFATTAGTLVDNLAEQIESFSKRVNVKEQMAHITTAGQTEAVNATSSTHQRWRNFGKKKQRLRKIIWMVLRQKPDMLRSTNFLICGVS